MAPELTAVGASALLAFCQLLFAATATALAMGADWAAGNRDLPADISGWRARSNRAARNMLDALILFAPVALAVQAADATSEVTAIGAEVFLLSRFLYAGAYVAGVRYLRTLLWWGGNIGTFMVASGFF